MADLPATVWRPGGSGAEMGNGGTAYLTTVSGDYLVTSDGDYLVTADGTRDELPATVWVERDGN